LTAATRETLKNRALYAAAGLTLFALGVTLRARHLADDIRCDEAITYFSYVTQPWRIALTDVAVANNHLLNTVLAKISIAALGDTLVAFRLPNFLAGFALMAAAALSLYAVPSTGVFILAVLTYEFIVSARRGGRRLGSWAAVWGGAAALALVFFAPGLLTGSGRGPFVATMLGRYPLAKARHAFYIGEYGRVLLSPQTWGAGGYGYGGRLRRRVWRPRYINGGGGSCSPGRWPCLSWRPTSRSRSCRRGVLFTSCRGPRSPSARLALGRRRRYRLAYGRGRARRWSRPPSHWAPSAKRNAS